MKIISISILLSLIVGLSSPLYIHFAVSPGKGSCCITTIDVCNRGHAGVSVNDDTPFILCRFCGPLHPPKAEATQACVPASAPLLLALDKDRPPKA